MLGTVRGYKTHLYLKPEAQFKLHKPRPLPLSIKPQVEAELERFVAIKELTPVDKTEFATTRLDAVLKPNEAVRLCKDFNISLNQNLNVQPYLLPTVADVLQTAGGETRFSKLDLADAYFQMELDEKS